jgi:Tol biopolymer transport system component
MNKWKILIISLGIISLIGGLTAQEPALVLPMNDRLVIAPLHILNSPFKEGNLSITPDGNTLYFTTSRGGQSWSHSYRTARGDSTHDRDIWVSRKVDGTWLPPQCLPPAINTSLGEDEPYITSDGKTLYYQSFNYMWDQTGGPYYRVHVQDNVYGEPKGLGRRMSKIMSKFVATGGVAFTPDRKSMILVAADATQTDMDLYLIRKHRGAWRPPQTLSLSTKENERSVFLASDGETLYFASDGYEGYGGLDIYKTRIDANGKPGVIVNLGPPINTPGDDYGFIISDSCEDAYFIRNGDIFHVDLTQADERMKP